MRRIRAGLIMIQLLMNSMRRVVLVEKLSSEYFKKNNSVGVYDLYS